MKYISTEKLIIKSWCESPEEGAIEQAKAIANLPFTFKHVCLMPDAHLGYGMPIGGVAAFKGVVSPNCVGVDIGCGCLSVKTSLIEISIERLKEIMILIRQAIPLGFNHHNKAQEESLMPKKKYAFLEIDDGFVFHDYPVVWNEYESALKQLGTLGGGNHFIEIQKGSDGYIWFMLHSGSRNLGYTVAKHYNKLAQELCKKWHSNIPECKGEDGLAFLPVDIEEGKAYLREMQYCLDFAKANRTLMAERIKEAFNRILDNIQFTEEINIHHNYAALENHFGENVWIHRKGAILARESTIGIIPGSQGTSSYIVRGKGNPDSFMSSSHGAGRKMSRTKAITQLDLDQEKKRLDDKGIIHAIRNKNDLEEAAGAYKDIDIVMEEQKNLVDILVKLEPLAVIKG